MSFITPASGMQGGTIAVSLTGSDFVSGATQLTAGNGVLVIQVNVLDATHLNALLMLEGPPGMRDIQVSTSGGVSNALQFEVKPGSLDSATNVYVEHIAGAPLASVPVDGIGSQARFSHPNYVWCAGGNLYVSENQAIRKIDIATARVTTLAGLAGTPGFIDGAGAQARFGQVQGIWADNAFVYVMDDGNGAIRKIDIQSGAVTTVATGLSPRATDGAIGGGSGLWGDGTYLYVTQYVTRGGSAAVMRVEIATGNVVTFAGNGTGNTADGAGTAAGFHYPIGISGDSTNLYVADASSLRQITIATAEVKTIMCCHAITAIFQDESGFYFTADANVSRFDRSTGAITIVAGSVTGTLGAIDGTAAAARFFEARGIWGSAGQLYVADWGNNGIRRITLATGEVTTFAGSIMERSMIDGDASSARFGYIGGMTSDGLNLYVADTGSTASPQPAIRKINIATGAVTTVAKIGASSMWTDGAFLYYSVGSFGGGEIRKLNLASGDIAVVAGNAFSSDLNPIDGFGTQARFPYPQAIWGDGDSLFVVDAVLTRCPAGPSCVFPTLVRYVVRRISIATGLVTTLSTAGLDNGPKQTMWGDGTYLYLPSYTSIYRISVATGTVTTLNVTLGVTPGGMWGDGSYLYMTNSYQHMINRLELATGIVTTVVSADAGQFQGPTAIWGDGAHLYVADLSAIYKVSAAGFQSQPVSARSFDIVDRGGVAISTVPSGTLTVGYAKLQVNAGLANPTGVAIFQYRPAGVTVTEAAVPASPLVQSGRIYTEVQGPADTGIAIANPNGQLAILSFFFTDASGSNFGSGTLMISANGQIARFLSEAPFSPGPAVQNAQSFTFTSSLPVAVIALRGYTNERSEFLITTLPVAAIGQVSTQPLYFPHFAVGGGWTTEVVLVNPTDAPLMGTVRFAGGQASNALPYSISPRSSAKLETPGSGGSINTGSIQVTPDPASTTPSGVVIFAFKTNGITVSETGVPSVPPAQTFRTYVENSGAFGSPSSLETGLAIANPSQSAITVSLDLFALDGLPFGSTGSVTVPALSQIPFFLNQVPAFTNLAPGFEGIARISTDSPNGMSVIALRAHYNERGDFLVATMPVVPESNPPSSDTMIFPHIVEGGGYTTQFVLFSGTQTQQSQASIQFFSQSGQDLPLTLK